ncbi:hypothetical protein ARMSODRAFT_1022679 [Armillaria solidipes]|uniref:Extracellular metalloproteinase n=1 Tax=Armillaria solidipes TaxID=1076256 RepID=A0A2H3BM75_9AGAR|nr:hypothetical protein ARMSODRAFT_1022679 [Armillaria solidipes]
MTSLEYLSQSYGSRQQCHRIKFPLVRGDLSIFQPSFDPHYDTALGLTGGSNIDDACTNAFYFVDKVYDYAYKYGWTEASYSFQSDSFARDERPTGGDHAGFDQED